MKYKYVNVVIILLAIVPSVCASGVRIPSLDRIRKKVDQALQNGSTVLSTQGNTILATLGMQNNQNPLHDAEKIMDCLNWSKQADVVKTLLNLKKESPHQAAQFLKELVKTQCVGTRSPLITFAHELADEERKLQDVFNLLLKSLGEKKSQHGNAAQSGDKVKVLFDQHGQCAQSLQQLIDVSNELLMA